MARFECFTFGQNSRCVATNARREDASVSQSANFIRDSSRHREPKTAEVSDQTLRRAAVSVICGPGLAVGTAACIQATLHGPHASHPHGLMESVALVLQGRQMKICNIKSDVDGTLIKWGCWARVLYRMSRR